MSGYEDEDGNTLYIDMKPLPNADVDIGLYTDDRCSVDYMGKIELETVVDYYEANVKYQNNQYQKDEHRHSHDKEDLRMTNLVKYMDHWNAGMDIYKQCQPCKAYSIDYQNPTDDSYWKNKYGSYWYYYKKNGEWNYDDDDDGENDYSNDDSKGNFLCEDDAGYKNVNQCMKFATHTKMLAATFRDVMTGAQQGTINEIYVGDIEVRPGAYFVSMTNWQVKDFVVIFFSGMFFAFCAYTLYMSYQRFQEKQAQNAEFKASLLT